MGKGMNDTELDKLLEEEMIREAEMIEHSLLCDDQTEDVHVSEEEIVLQHEFCRAVETGQIIQELNTGTVASKSRIKK